MRNLLTILSCCLSLSMFAQNLEVEGKAKITQMDKVNTADSIIVWLPDSTLGIRDAASLNKQLIDSDGDTKVLVEENPDDDIIRFYSGNNEIIRIDSSGRVGIGTDAPTARLEVDGNASINSSAGSTELLVNTPATSTSSLKLIEAGEFGFQFEYDGALNVNKLYLRSRGFAGNDAVRMTWLKDGKVGIGTNFPDRELTVFDNDNNGDAVINLRAVNPENREMIIGINQSSGGIFGMLTENDLYLRTNGSNRMVISSGGSVGIGTNNPKALLHVDSAVLFTGIFDDENPSSPPVSGSGARLMWYPGRAAFRAGRVLGTEWDGNNIGSYSIATGQNTIGSGFVSTAMGNSTIASGSRSTAMGFDTNASGSASTAMGSGTTASGNESTAMGDATSASGSASTAMGLGTTASGNRSTAMGEGTNASASGSTAMGFQTQANGFASTVLGMYNDPIVSTQLDVEPTTPLFIIGNGEVGAGNESNAMVVRKDGKVGIGTNTPASAIFNALVEIKDGHIALSNNYGVFSNNSTGTAPGAGFDTSEDDDLYLFAGGMDRVTLNANGSFRPSVDDAYACGTPSFRWSEVYAANGTIQTSDARYKQDIHPLTYGLKEVLQMQPVSYKWRNSSDHQKHVGLIAQEVQELVPEVVRSSDQDHLGMNYTELVPVLINAIKELAEQQEVIDSLEKKNELLETELESLKGQITELFEITGSDDSN